MYQLGLVAQNRAGVTALNQQDGHRIVSAAPPIKVRHMRRI